MKTATKKLYFILALSTIALFVGILFLTTNAFADQKQSNDRYVWDFEKVAEADRMARTDHYVYSHSPIILPYAEPALPEEKANSCNDDVWRVKNGKANRVKTTINGHDHYFEYHIRGYFGNKILEMPRCAHIQFFYNLESKVLLVLCFGNGNPDDDGEDPSHGSKFETMDYLAATWKTILEDDLEFGDDTISPISSTCKTIYLDPRIQNIGHYGFEKFQELELVDIYQQDYEGCQLINMARKCFQKMKKTVCVDFLKGIKPYKCGDQMRGGDAYYWLKHNFYSWNYESTFKFENKIWRNGEIIG